MRYKFIPLLLIFTLFTNCLVLKVDKDSEPLKDFGSPLAGSFNNKQYAKGIVYTVLFTIGVIGIILFAPGASDDGSTGRGVLPIDRNIADPIFYSLLGSTLSVPIISTIDTAGTYHMVNKKILELNDVEWDPREKHELNKYETIMEIREAQLEKELQEAENERLKNYEDELEYYRDRLINGTITEEELLFIEKADFFRTSLQNELGFYYVEHGTEEDMDKIRDYNDELNYYKERLLDGTISQNELVYIKNTPFLREQLKEEIGQYYLNKE